MESSGGGSSSSSSQGQAHSQNQAQLSSAEIAFKLSISDSNSNTKSKSKSPSSSSNGNADANFGVCNGILKAGGSGNGNGVQRSKSFAFRAPSQVYCIDDFDRQKTLGVGSYSRVVRAKKKDTGKVYALKIMEKGFILKENKAQYVKLERVVLDQLDHAGIVKLYFTFQDKYNIYLGLESCDGGELFDQITRKGCLSEEEARFYAAEIIDVLEYLHKLGLVHRDIKPENVLLTTDGHVKLADFGSVKPMENTPIEIIAATSNEKACSFVGTAAYVPPEVLDQGPVTIGNDLWALGCTLYQMLAASSPFKDASEWLTFQRIINRNFHFPDHFSPEAKDLINKLLDKDPSKRLGYGPNGYASLKNHPFFRGVDWDNVRGMPAPKLAPLVAADKDEDSDTDDWLSSQLIPETADDEMVPKDKETASSSAIPDNKPRFTSINAFDSRWENFLGPGEAVVMVSMVKKMRKLYNKKRLQLILTDKPKLFYVDPVKMVLKGEIQWSNNSKELFVQVLNSSNFKLCTVKKTILFEDLKQLGWKWKEMIESLQRQ